MHLRTLGPDDLDAVFDCFHRAFADYVVPLRLSRDDLVFMTKRRGADLTVSAGAFDGDTMVAVMVVAFDTFEGIPSAYDVFTGVAPEARGQALARRLFDTATPAVRERGAERFVLEVIRDNASAVHSYSKIGFAERRRLRVFAFDAIDAGSLDVEEIDVEEGFDSIPMRSAAPSWQNSDASIRRVARDIVALRVSEAGRTTGVAFCCPLSRDVPQIHVEPGHDDAVRALLAAARARNIGNGPLRVINVDAEAQWMCDTLATMATEEYPSQFEMVRAID